MLPAPSTFSLGIKISVIQYIGVRNMWSNPGVSCIYDVDVKKDARDRPEQRNDLTGGHWRSTSVQHQQQQEF